MPQGHPSTPPKIRTSEEILADECVSTALALLNLRRRVQSGDLSAVQQVARQGAQLQHLANTVESALRQRNEIKDCVFLLVIGRGGEQ